MMLSLAPRGSFGFLALTLSALASFATMGASQEIVKPVVVKFHEPKTDVAEAAVAIDPAVHVDIQDVGRMAFGLTVDGARLCFGPGSIMVNFKIDNQIVYSTAPRPFKLPAATPNGKARHGYYSSFRVNNLNITQVIEAIPSQPAKPGNKRRLDTVLIRHIIENKDTQPHTVGTRVYIDTFCRTNDGALFAAPTMPKKILDGIELKDKTLPPYVQILERPDLANPGFVGHFTLKMGKKMIGPDRFVCTIQGAGDNGWDLGVMQAMGDSAAGLFWSPRVVPAGGKVEFAFAYGKGLASTLESEGRISIAFGGSFEPNKLFTLSATVVDPLSNQTLALQLPPGMELVEGKSMQPVPPPTPDSASSLVLWKCRVKELGQHAIRISSSNSITQTRTLTIARPADNP